MHPLVQSARRAISACAITPRSQDTPARRRFVPHLSGGLEERSLLSAFVPAARAADRAGLPTDSRTPISPGLEAVAPQLQNVTFPTVNGQYEQLDVYEPTSSLPAGGRPVMIAIHGGGWRRFNKTGFGEPHCQCFCVARLRCGRSQLCALRAWVALVAGEFRGRPGRGALGPRRMLRPWTSTRMRSRRSVNQPAPNLAALLGTYSPGAGSAAVDSVIALSSPTSLALLYHESPLAGLAVKQFLGGTPAQVPASYEEASPIDQVAPGDPPMLLVQGKQDPLIPMSQSVAMAPLWPSRAYRTNSSW